MIKVLFIKYLLRKGLLLIAMAGFSLLAVVGLDFATYKQLTAQEQVLKVFVTKQADNQYQVRLKSDSFDKSYQLAGDQWQIDFRLIRFSPMVSMTGLSHLYQASRLSNRYASIEDQRSNKLYLYSLRDEKIGSIDLWDFFQKYNDMMPIIDTTFGSAVFMPMTDNAEYEILIGFSGLVVKAANEDSQLAVQNWQ